ncbi:Predicted membrane protein [Blautia hydrogenotrophica]|uniref:putative ABC transporter permease n=1 Tax=Blautia hydrogenotrophica TaxID=53443 RepID=UPI0006C266EF|nr:putative ABC transporter permease [Blautia hydrogenotrophica]CUM76390.1 Predicted membrane protein [Blautia hydrogenotrophica]SCI33865.1 Predicted membrane protein [uncultured Blautia sp.]
MKYAGMELVWLLLAYSFFGWVIETIAGTIKKKKFVNRGFSSGPFCLIYGIAAVMMTTTMQELIEYPFFLFLGCAILATIIEWFAGKLLERLNQHKWWDYSEKKWNFDGYICLQYSILWGILGVLTVRFADRWLVQIYDWIPELFRTILMTSLLVLMALDLSVSLAAVFNIRRQIPAATRQWNHRVAVWTQRFSRWIISRVERRMEKAYPVIFEATEQIAKQGTFAEGCCFYKLFWLFFIGAVLGDFTETIFCRITAGEWMSRSSLVWGPFSIVWGLALVFATVLLYKDREKPDRHIFIAGTLLGGAYEYICSIFTEIAFGKVFWDYSKIPFNLGGRINLLYCFFWGIAAVLWIKLLYPHFSRWIEKIPVLWGYVLTWTLAVFLAVNMAVSVMALVRYERRAAGDLADSAWERIMDEHFDDNRMEKIYPNAIER